MSEEQVYATLKEKGELTWANGCFRIKVNKVDDRDLIDVELRSLKPGEASILVAPKAQIREIDRQAGTMLILFYDAKITRGELEIEIAAGEWDYPAPRQGSRH
jgi:hypothetical protein